MPVPGQQPNFAQDFLAGASVVNQSLERSARIQQLRLQEAQQRLAERTQAAQAAMLLEHVELYKQQRLEQEHENDLRKAAGEQFFMLRSMGLPDEQAFEDATMPLAIANPKVYKDIQDAKIAKERLEFQRETATTKADIAYQGLVVARERIEALKTMNELAVAQRDEASQRAAATRLKVAELEKEKHLRDLIGETRYRTVMNRQAVVRTQAEKGLLSPAKAQMEIERIADEAVAEFEKSRGTAAQVQPEATPTATPPAPNPSGKLVRMRKGDRRMMVPESAVPQLKVAGWATD